MNKSPNSPERLSAYTEIPHQNFHDTDSNVEEGTSYPNLLQGGYAQLNSFQNNQSPNLQQTQDIRNNQHIPSNQGYPILPNPTNQTDIRNRNQTSAYQPFPPSNQHMVQPNIPFQQNNPNLINYAPTAFECKDDTLSIQMPQIMHQHIFQKIFPRKVPQNPMTVNCPACNHQVTSKVQRHFGMGALGCTLGLALCCTQICWLPFCIKDCHDLHHRCPDCGYTIAQEKFLCK